MLSSTILASSPKTFRRVFGQPTFALTSMRLGSCQVDLSYHTIIKMNHPFVHPYACHLSQLHNSHQCRMAHAIMPNNWPTNCSKTQTCRSGTTQPFPSVTLDFVLYVHNCPFNLLLSIDWPNPITLSSHSLKIILPCKI